MATGLRVRKRLAVMRRVQGVALDLYDERGYGDVSLEQIAERAEVSLSSVYRYFGSKEGVLLWNPYRDDALARYGAPRADESLLSEFRRVAHEVLGDVVEGEDWHRRRLRYLLDEPALFAALGGQLMAAIDLVAQVLASRTGRAPAEAPVQATAGAMVGALLGALRSWRASDYTTPLVHIVEQTFDTVEDGLPLISNG